MPAKSKPLEELSDAPPGCRESREWLHKGENEKQVDAKIRREITSLRELLDFFEVDEEEWEVDRWLCNQWQMGAKADSGEVEIHPLYQVKAWFKRRVDHLSRKKDAENLVADAKKILAKAPKLPAVRRSRKKKPYLFVPSIMDPHFGKLCWHRETGWENYDVDTAERLVLAAAADLAEQASVYDIGRILFPVGNDFFHVDGGRNQTTAGTDQDVDGRWFRAYRKGREVVMKTIVAFSQIAPVDVVIVVGNHDETLTLTLGDALDVAFSREKWITVDCEPRHRKYYEYGANLLGLDHGKLSFAKLTGMMQVEARAQWGRSKYAEWLRGHIHKKSESTWVPVDEERGMRVRQIPSLTPPDFWHANSGYVGSIRAAEGLIYHEEDGWRAQFNHIPKENT